MGKADSGVGRRDSSEKWLESRRSTPESALQGRAVLVTRPAHQAQHLVGLIQEAGGRAVLWPVLEIVPPAREPEQLASQLAAADIAIFISPNAVEQTLARVPPVLWPARPALAAVGAGTARMLREQLGRGPTLCPNGQFDSEGLLALPALQQIAGKRVVILRGEGGRELLANTLRARGAQVEYAEVYRRRCPEQAPEEARAAVQAGAVGVVLATSAEGLRNLVHMAGPLADSLRRLPLIVVSERVAVTAAELGFNETPRQARAASDEAMLEAVVTWASGRER